MLISEALKVLSLHPHMLMVMVSGREHWSIDNQSVIFSDGLANDEQVMPYYNGPEAHFLISHVSHDHLK
jgi:hypothetical protein